MQEFTHRLGGFGRIVIAGGAVRDTLLGQEPKDFDVFVLHDEGVKFSEMKKALVPAVADLTPIPPVVEWHNSEPFLVVTINWHGKQIQILANPAPNPEALVDTFDWSVCLYAYFDDSLIAREPVDNIKPGGELWLNRVTYPLSTLRRGFRFSERFLMKLRREDIDTICAKVLEKGQKQEPDRPSEEKNRLVQ